jgi:P-type Ca2+ transporter type 2C
VSLREVSLIYSFAVTIKKPVSAGPVITYKNMEKSEGIKHLATAEKTSLEKGLTEQEASRRLELYGPNQIQTEKEKTIVKILSEQFLSPVTYLLIAAAFISFALGDIAEGIAIVVVIVINAAIGFYMELSAITSMKALKQMDIARTKVIRNGKLREISSVQITNGDLVVVEAGDLIPADATVVESNQLQVDESMLTGESLPVSKKKDHKTDTGSDADSHHLVFKGTIAVKGNAKAIVTGIGKNTELGKISKMVHDADQSATPLEKKLQSLAKKLIWLTIIIAVIFFITGWIREYNLVRMMQTAIAMAVAAIPEGLPIVATIALAYGMIKMAKKNVIVKHLSAVETLGSANIILTDKTGTLTENKITAVEIVTATNAYKTPLEKPDDAAVEKLFFIAALCNDASIEGNLETGDPLEIALLKWVEQNNYDSSHYRKKYKRIYEEAFSSETKIMATFHEHEDLVYICVKGAVEEVLKRSLKYHSAKNVAALEKEMLEALHSKANDLAEQGIRVLALAYSEINNHNNFNMPDELIFAGLIGFSDPPNEKVPSAIDQCKEAGIRIVMLTGDHPATAFHIAKQVHLATHKNQVVNGKEFDTLQRESKKDRERLLNATVFARVTPKQKLDIVDFYQSNGFIAAMTGDGVNDAPALKKADIGIAMGIRGTQIAKETADLVLKDDSFISIISGIRQGRIIFENIRKCIVFLLSCNLTEIIVITVTALLSLSSPLTPLQILYLNLITDVFPALAIAVSRGNKNIMKKPPRDPAEGLLTKQHWKAIIIYSALMALCVFGAFIYSRDYIGLDIQQCNNIVFISLALAQLWHVFNLPAAETSFFKNEITQNKYIWLALIACLILMAGSYFILPVRNVLSVKELNAQLLMTIFIASILPVALIQLFKRLKITV